jgi:hypothetical protein
MLPDVSICIPCFDRTKVLEIRLDYFMDALKGLFTFGFGGPGIHVVDTNINNIHNRASARSRLDYSIASYYQNYTVVTIF